MTCLECGTPNPPKRPKFCSKRCSSRHKSRRYRSDPIKGQREREAARVRYAQDPKKAMARTLNWRLRHPENARLAARKAQLKVKYGMTPETYQELLADQGGVCAVCRQPADGFALAVDHDHACCPHDKSCGRCIRGLLCSLCNQAIGFLHDDPTLLRKAAVYLERATCPF